ncbi:MAG TPA: penicillin acylase family protein [Steroidobacteraceae bacterium]|nr:penicillin acylase family protein [Steroidobacteraceae bacterium]
MAHRALRRALLLALAGLLASLLLALLGLALLWRASLPGLDGERAVAGLRGAVVIERDALGVPTLSALDRGDLAFGTGFVHAQDRFFQMDLARRLAAGELAELVGAAALPLDRQTRLYRFRAVARQALAAASPAERALLAAYTRGVNAGLASLASRPWEYWLLGSRPAAWRPEDSYLVAYSMWWDLQHGEVRDELLRQRLALRLSAPALRFLYPERTAWDSPNQPTLEALRAEDARNATLGELPTPADLNVRTATSRAPPSPGAAPARGEAPPRAAAAWLGAAQAESGSSDVGSNNWALAGRLTASGAALVASDMHLGLRLPTTWYRARLRLRGLDLNGLTLPGEPLLIAGSNGHIAWAFTNSAGHWLEVRPVTCLAIDAAGLRTPQGELPLALAHEVIHVHGGPDVVLEVRSGARGTLLQWEPGEQRCWLVSWLAQIASATNLQLQALELAASAREALALAPQIGIPHQNLVVGDRDGHIGWAIAGRVPVAVDPGRTLAGAPWRAGSESPQLYDPPLGRLWTANARATSEPAALAAIGADTADLGASYYIGARARQIRDDLLALTSPATPLDMLRIQLDVRARFLARWRELLLALTDPALPGSAARAELRRLVQSSGAAADVDAVGYRLVRAFRTRTAAAVWQMLLGAAGVASDAPPPSQFDQPLWTLIERQPRYLLSAHYASWRQFLLAQLDATRADLQRRCGGLERCRWGAAHPVAIRHPLSGALPLLASWLDLPTLELPGDHDMPRVQDGAFGASERFAVSPGHESEGYLHLPGGESGHPLSPYYRAGYEAWARGQPTPLLPGPARHRLTLRPRGGL